MHFNWLSTPKDLKQLTQLNAKLNEKPSTINNFFTFVCCFLENLLLLFIVVIRLTVKNCTKYEYIKTTTINYYFIVLQAIMFRKYKIYI